MGRPKKFKREDVIQTAMELFWLKGYSATSLSDLTEATGLNKKSLYNEFGSKHDLFKVSLEAYNLLKGHQVDILSEKPLGKANVIRYLEDLAESSSTKGCLLSLSIFEEEHLEQDSRGDVRNTFKGLEGLILKNLRCDFGQKRAQSLALLMSSMMFSVAGLGKMKIEKKRMKLIVSELSKLLE